jgi:predicted Zn-dependent protease
MEKRLMFLESLVQSGKADSFARYGLAIEYKRLGRPDDALDQFQRLRDLDPSYVPQYLMAGQLLLSLARKEEARAWLRAGVAQAKLVGNSHAQGELESALADCD